jgi:hypothetical protein
LCFDQWWLTDISGVTVQIPQIQNQEKGYHSDQVLMDS